MPMKTFVDLIQSYMLQYFALISSLFVLGTIIFLVRRRQILERYSVIWFLFGIAFIILAVWKKLLHGLAAFLGIHYPPAALFLLLWFSIFVLLIYYSVILSRLSEDRIRLAQELALLKQHLKAMESEKQP